MGVDTKGLVKYIMSGEEVAVFLRHSGYEVTNVRNPEWSIIPGDKNPSSYSTVCFVDHKSEDAKTSNRMMSIFSQKRMTDYAEDTGYSDAGTVISLSHFGNSKEIIRGIIDQTGGWFLESDASDDWQQVVATVERTSDDIHADRISIAVDAALKAIQKTVQDLGLNMVDNNADALRDRILGAVQDAVATPDAVHENNASKALNMR